MKNLVFIRHGKATRESMPDIKRHLIEKGIKRTKKFAFRLRESGINPGLIVSSPAVRAFETAQLIAEIYAFPKEKILINQGFYFHSLQTTVHQIYSFPDEIDTIFMVGHNPVWTDLADHYAQTDIWHLRTSGMVAVRFDTDTWKNIEQAGKKDLIIIN
jgi:phosphohistidine phosphatase